MSEVGKVCHWALKEYIDNQWRWPRESDLVVELVTELKKIVGNDFSTKKFDGKLVDKDGKDEEGICKNTLRIRTEVRLGIGESQRVDICLLNENPTLYYNKGYGRRNIELAIKPDDVHEILEVKLDPHKLLYWVDDIIKLKHIHDKYPEIHQHLIAIDNSLYLQSNLMKGKSPIALHSGWPLQTQCDINISGYKSSKPKQKNQVYSINLKHIKDLSTCSIASMRPGIYLWALGVTSGQAANSTVAVQPSCWQLDTASFVEKLNSKYVA